MIILFISPQEASKTCHYPVYIIRQQKEGQIPAKLKYSISLGENGCDSVKT